MKTRKLLARLRNFLDADRAEQEREMDSIRKVLEDLREKQRKFENMLEEKPDRDDREEIEGKLRAIRTQRTKGVDRLRGLSRREGNSKEE